MDEVMNSQSASPISPSAEAQNRATADSSRLIRFAVVALSFVIHLVALAGLCGLTVATASYYFGDGLDIGFVLLALACLAGASAIVIARDLSPIPRSIVTVLSIAIFGITGIAEVVGRIAPPTQDIMVLTIGEVFPLIAMFVFPFVTAGMLVASGRQRAAAATGNMEGGGVGVKIVLLACALIVASSLFPMFGLPGPSVVPSGFEPSWPMVLGSAVGTVAAVIVLERALRDATSSGRSMATRVAGYIVLVCGMHLCILSTAQIVDAISLGRTGALMWVGSAFGFIVAAVALFIASFLRTQRTPSTGRR